VNLLGIAFSLGFLLGACRSETSQTTREPAASSQNQNANEPGLYLHFFSVAWGCVQVEKAKLEAASYTIQDYKTAAGACPADIAVIDLRASPLLTCSVSIGAAGVPGTYILYDKRSLDGKNVADLKAEGFTASNFCPMLAQKKFN
jgi:hypothetical protein